MTVEGFPKKKNHKCDFTCRLGCSVDEDIAYDTAIDRCLAYHTKKMEEAKERLLTVGEIENILLDFIFDEKDGHHSVKAGLAQAIAQAQEKKWGEHG